MQQHNNIYYYIYYYIYYRYIDRYLDRYNYSVLMIIIIVVIKYFFSSEDLLYWFCLYNRIINLTNILNKLNKLIINRFYYLLQKPVYLNTRTRNNIYNKYK